MTLHPAYISPENRPLRRKVALTYRSMREAGRSHHAAMDAAMEAYFEECPEERADRPAASHQVAIFIASAVNADPEWFWRPMKTGDYWRKG